MKRLVRKQNFIYGMAFPRKQVLNRLTNYAEIINKHTIYCVVYGKTIKYKTLNHWVGELSTWMNFVDKTECNVKLKPINYVETVFSEFGTTKSDAEVNLIQFLIDNDKLPDDKKYPTFEINDELIDSLYMAYQKLIDVSIPIFLRNGTTSRDDWQKILMQIFN